MHINQIGQELVAFLEGRIDSSNSGEIQKQLEDAMAEHLGMPLIIDAGELQYISSAGLRVLLQIRKRQGRLTVRNVSAEVYDIFEMTGFSELLEVRRKLREISIDGCRVIGRGAIGTVYRVDEDTIVKVYELPDSLPMIENEQKRAKQAFLKGIPTAISYDVVRVGEKYGSVFEMLKATTYNDLIIENPDRLEEIVQEYARFIRGVHSVQMEKGELPEARDIYLDYLNALREYLPEEIYEPLRGLFEAMPENLHVIHGDIQMKNVMISDDEPLLIDMDTLCVGDPVFDLSGAYVAYVLFNEDDPGNSLQFMGIDKQMSDEIWHGLLHGYFEAQNADVYAEIERKVRIVASVRFLYLLLVLGIGDPELKPVRVNHTLEKLRDLLPLVHSLILNSEAR